MRRARIRHYALIGLVVLAASSMLPSLGGGSKTKPAAVATQRARYESTAKAARSRTPAPIRRPKINTWAER